MRVHRWVLNAAIAVSSSFFFGVGAQAQSSPTITSLSPTAGAFGATVTITGTNFGSSQGSSTVKFNGTTATATSWNSTTIVATVPSGATTGNVVVRVSGTSSNGVSFTLVPAPNITSLSVTSGSVGTPVTITGTNFGSPQGSGTVTFNGTTASVTSWGASSIAVTVPSGATTGNVVVNASGVASNGIAFTVVSAPSIASLSPATGAVGAQISISGSNFGDTQASSTVKLNGTTATPTSWAAGSISVLVPSGSTTGNVVVTTSGGSSNGVNFTVVPSPSISSLSVTTGVVGTPVTITGSNFGATQGAGTVSFNGIDAVVASWGSTSIATTVPTGATTGNVIVGASGVASNGINFTVTEALSITGISPTSGAVGEMVTITGTGFGASQGTSTISLNGTTASVASWGDKNILALVPAGATSGTFSVTVAGHNANSSTFNVTALPSGWSDSDVGSVGLAGSARFANGTFTVTGGGLQIYGTSDAFNFAYQPLNGDGTILARVVSVQGTTGYGTAGVMIRNTLDAASANARTGDWPPYAAIGFDVRATSGASATQPGSVSVSLPYWVMVVRSGSTFSGYTSADGVNWAQLGTGQTISMAQTVYVGLTVCSGTTSTLAAATFDSVSISSAAAPAPVITGISATTGPIGGQVILTGTGFGATQNDSLVTLNNVPVTVNSWSATSITITVPSGATSGPLLVSVAPTMNDSNSIYFTVTAQPLPSSWLDQDIGSVGLVGSATFANGTFTVAGAGLGTVSTPDSFHFVYQPLSGDGTLMARVVSLQGGSAPEAGVMIRETLNASAANAFMFVGGTYIYMSERTTTGGSPSYQTGPAVTLPYWVKLVRSGSSFSGFSSLDGVTWTQVGTTQTITMAQSAYLGLGVTSRTATGLTTATFDNVSVSTSTSPAPVITGLSATTGMIGSPVVITGTGFGAQQAGSIVYLNGVPVTTDAWTATSITIIIPAGATSGPLQVSVAPSMNDSNWVYFEVTTHPLPIPWLDLDIGSVGVVGSATFANGVFTISGAGAGMQNGATSDSFHFMYQALSGDGTIIARVSSIQGGSSFPYIGAMIRETLTPGSNDVFVDFNPNFANLFYRSSTGAANSIQQTGLGAPAYPYWVKVTRSGNTFSAFASADAVTWIQVGTTQTITMATNVYIGLAVSSAYVTAATVTFDNVSVSTPSSPAPVITGLSATTGSIGSQVVISGSAFGSAQNSSVVTLNTLPVIVNSWSATAITITIPAGATSGPLQVSVAPSMNDSNAVYFAVTTQPLPTPWLDQDIGSVGAIGSATFINGVFTIMGAGPGVGGGATSDAFHFMYQAISGNGTIIARVATNPGNLNQQIGAVIRETLSPAATQEYVYYWPNASYLSYRTTTGGGNSVVATSFSSPTQAYWVKITRTGNTISAFTSGDAVTWTQSGTSQTITMASNVYVGLGVGGYATLLTATFDNVSVSTTSSPAPVITGLSATSGSIGSQVTLTGTGFGAQQGGSIVYLNAAPVTINSWSATSITVTIPSGATSGRFVVSVAPSMNDSNGVNFTVTTQPLPSPWLDQDIGSVGIVGSATYASGTFAVMGTGQGIQGTADAFHFAYHTLSGDGTIIARVANIQGGFDQQVGIMIRETLTPGSTATFVSYQPNQAYFFYRPTTGASLSSGYTSFGRPAYPYWSKLTRSGNTFSAYVSPDGVYWTQVGTSQTIAMATNVYAGLCSGGYATLVTGSFDNVSVTSGTPYLTPVVTSLSPAVAGPGYSVTISGSNFGSTQGSSTVYFNGTQATTITSWSTGQIKATVPNSATTGPVTVVVNNIGSNQNVSLTIYRPVLTSILPPAAAIGEHIVLNGTGFIAAGSGVSVSMNGTITSGTALSDTTVDVNVPTGVTTGPLTVSVGGVPSNALQFTLIEALSITGISPSVGPIGTSVTMTGTGFGPSQSNSVASFYGAPGTVTSWSDTQIVMTFPSGASSGLATMTVAGVTVTGPWYTQSTTVTIADSLGNPSSYTSQVIGGTWVPVSIQGSGCSSCSQRGTKQSTYDAKGNILTKTDELGRVTSYTYDANSNVTSVSVPIAPATYATTTYTYNSFGEVLTTTDPMGFVTTNTYDANGNLLSVSSPAPNSSTPASVTQFAYNSLGELTQITDPLSNITALTYYPTGLINTIKDAQNNVTTYVYDTHGNRTSVTDALQNQTTFAYDAWDRLTTITYPSSTGTTVFAYDNRGRRTSVTDQNGKKTTYAYDDADRLISVTDASTPGNVTTYAYDTENNLISITDANNHTTSFAYDTFGRVTKSTFPSSTSEYYYYDAVGNLITKTDRKNQTINYTYDQLSRLEQKLYPDSTAVNYTYDNDSRLTQVTDPTGTYQFTFDNMGRLTGAVAQYSFLTGRNFSTSYSYDAASNRTGFTDPENGATGYVYDTLNRLQTLTPPAAISSGNFGFSYDALSRRTQMTRPNGLKSVYAYDNLSRLLSVLHQSGSTTLDGAAYAVDNAGNRTSRTPQPSGIATNYTYDPIYELLTAVQGSTTTESYTYDPVGNRLSSLGVSPYVNNASNELTSTPSATYTYDNNGNMLTKVVGSNTTSYAWDFENRLSNVTLPGSGGTVSFKYDPFGRRIYKSSTSGTSIFAYDGDNLIEETNASGTAVSRYSQNVDVDALDEPLAMLRSGATSFYHADGLGSVTSLSTSAGAIASTYAYDSFGKLTASTGSVMNPFRYTAREFDSETALYYYRARYYDPSVGRFSSEDPAGFSSDSLNFYDYVSNNPLVFSDPSGLKKIHGNWCGPNWTGGKKEPFIPSNDTPGYYAPPIDYVDIPCSNHDKCYSKCRDKHPCSPWGRRACERKCDFSLVGGILGHPFSRVRRDDGSLSLPNILNPWAPIIGLGIALDFVPPAGPNGGADPYHPDQPAGVKCCKTPPLAGPGSR